MIKSPAEIEYIRKSTRFTEAGMKSLAEGKTENEIAAKVFEAMIAAGSEFPSTAPIITGGWKSGIPHTTFHRLVLREGDAILFEIGGVYNRYTAALMRSAVIGKGDPEINLMNDICSEAVQAAIDIIKPGVTSGEVDEACRGLLKGQVIMNVLENVQDIQLAVLILQAGWRLISSISKRMIREYWRRVWFFICRRRLEGLKNMA